MDSTISGGCGAVGGPVATRRVHPRLSVRPRWGRIGHRMTDADEVAVLRELSARIKNAGGFPGRDEFRTRANRDTLKQLIDAGYVRQRPTGLLSLSATGLRRVREQDEFATAEINRAAQLLERLQTLLEQGRPGPHQMHDLQRLLGWPEPNDARRATYLLWLELGAVGISITASPNEIPESVTVNEYIWDAKPENLLNGPPTTEFPTQLAEAPALGGYVPPLRDDVTVETVTDNPQPEGLSRTRKVQLLQSYIAEGAKILSGRPRPLGEVRKAGDPRGPAERWQDDVRKAITLADATGWSALVVPANTSLPTLTRANELLGVLMCRIKAGKAAEVTEDERQAIDLMGVVLVWGDHLSTIAKGSRVAGTWEGTDYEALIRDRPQILARVEAKLTGHVPQQTLDRALSLARTHLDADLFAYGASAPVSHAGWAMWAIAWWLSDLIGYPFTIAGVPSATFAEVTRTRHQFLALGRVECPRCRSDVEIGQDRSAGIVLPTAQWICRSCDVAGVFPVKTVPESPWFEPEPYEDEQRGADGAFVATTHFEAPDLSWVSDTALRRIVEQDFDEMSACLDAKAAKAVLLLAGSACEGLLIEALQRNAPIAQSHFKRPQEFPDRASLEQLVEVAVKEGLISTASADFAPEMNKYRDLIHPHRFRRGDIKVTLATARLIANAAVVLATDLADAANDGRIAAFESR